MDSDMLHKISFLGTAKVTMGAWEGPLPCVCPPVAQEIALNCSFVRAKGTLVFHDRMFAATMGTITPHTPVEGWPTAMLPACNANCQLICDVLLNGP